MRTSRTVTVSIPHWSDLSQLATQLRVGTLERFNPTLVRFELDARASHVRSCSTVSIPHWSDLSQPSSVSVPAHDAVSIPHWSDLSRRCSSAIAASHAGFNPTLVRFEPRMQRQSQTTASSVSIPHWSDLSSMPQPLPQLRTPVSIPHWSDLSLAMHGSQHVQLDAFQSHIGPI